MNIENIKQELNYNPTTGVFYWNKAWGRARIGNVAGSVLGDGYRYIKIGGKHYASHQLAWFYTYNEWPKDQIDHINGDILDNRICNLRIVSNRENQQNQKRHRNGFLCGATPKGNKWQSQIKMNGTKKYLGLFNTELEAHNAYISALARHPDEERG